jgi:hypothetical protein
MIKKRIPVLGLILIIYSLASGSDLGFGTVTLSLDTLGFDDTLFIQAEIINYDTGTYNAPISFGYKINGVQNVSTSIFNASVSGQLVKIGPQDSVPVTIVVVVTPDYFEIGPDILVVWPIAFTDGTNNYTEQSIFVTDPPTGIQNLGPPGGLLRAFYFNQSVYLNITDPDIILNQVRIFDVEGKQVFCTVEYNLTTKIPFANESAGIYFIEVRYNSDERKVMKLVKF